MDQVDDVVLGNVVGNGGNVARKSLLEAGLNHFWHNFRPSMWLGFRKYHLCVSNGAM